MGTVKKSEAKVPAKRGRGRPTTYDPHTIMKTINVEIASSTASLREICRRPEMPGISTVMEWLQDYEDIRLSYIAAREAQADIIADEIIAIADGELPVIEGELIEAAAEDRSDGDPQRAADALRRFEANAIARDRLRLDARKWVAAKLKPGTYGDSTVSAADRNKVNIAVQFNFNFAGRGNG